VLALSYSAAAVVLHHDPAWNVLPNTVSYFANNGVSWAFSRLLRRNGTAVDAARAQAVARADELAQERERLRHSRLLHDHVLQTLETLARGSWIADIDLRAHVAADAAWLRALVEGTAPAAEDGSEPSDLGTALQRTVQAPLRTGLSIELNISALTTPDSGAQIAALPTQMVTALTAAVHEALTNVAKHAGVTTAVVRAAAAGHELRVSVLDHGCGFDTATVRRGIGLNQSILARMTAAGGSARISSSPGTGTYIELCVPLPVSLPVSLAAATPDSTAADRISQPTP
jgi:signal transduction histidine kinase